MINPAVYLGMLNPLAAGEMIDKEDIADWECLHNYDHMTTRACVRLDQIADSERVMGYEESATMYAETAIELKACRAWYHEQYTEAVRTDTMRA